MKFLFLFVFRQNFYISNYSFRALLNLCLLVLLGFNLVTCRIKIDFKYYKKSVEIDQSISSLKDNCLADIKEFNLEQMFPKLDKKIKNKISLVKYYDVSSKNKNNDKKTKENIFILGGEHPRELIASELVYNLIYFLCKPEPNDLNTVNDLLKNFNFRIIVNANPSGRKIVEEGEYCRRTNYNNVDINRNWDIFWGETTNSSEENPGSSAFSEIETKFVLNSIKDYNAKLFLTIHSGIFGLYLPYAYLEKEGK